MNLRLPLNTLASYLQDDRARQLRQNSANLAASLGIKPHTSLSEATKLLQNMLDPLYTNYMRAKGLLAPDADPKFLSAVSTLYDNIQKAKARKGAEAPASQRPDGYAADGTPIYQVTLKKGEKAEIPPAEKYDITPMLEQQGFSINSADPRTKAVVDQINGDLRAKIPSTPGDSKDFTAGMLDSLKTFSLMEKVQSMRKGGNPAVAVYSQKDNLDCSSLIQDMYETICDIDVGGATSHQKEYFTAEAKKGTWAAFSKSEKKSSQGKGKSNTLQAWTAERLDDGEWAVCEGDKNVAVLQEGDIIQWENGSKGTAHTAIYLGGGLILDRSAGNRKSKKEAGVMVRLITDLPNENMISMVAQPPEKERFTRDDIFAYFDSLDKEQK